jgi:tRNA threonylcarbamoyladenosine biosynthesis protein TsaB
MTAEFRCLAVETATGMTSIAACDGDRVSVRRGTSSRGGARDIYQLVQEALEEAGLKLQALDCIAYGCGPGGFTGLRVGAAVTQALAFGASVPVCRVSSLAVLAAGAIRKHRAPLVAPCLDARMGEAYLALYRDRGQQIIGPELEDCLVDPAAFVVEPGEPFLAAGPGWAAYPDLRDRHAARMVFEDFDLLPSAEDLLFVARHHFESGQVVRAEDATPNYIRDKVTQ